MSQKSLKSLVFVGITPIIVQLSGCGGSSGSSGLPPTNGPVSNAATAGQSTVASRVIDSAGGILTVTDATSVLNGTSVTIPPGALSGATTITISEVSGGGGFPTGTVVANLGPSGTTFAKPVQVTLKYTQAYLNSNNIVDATTLKVVSADTGIANETLLTLSQDLANRTITSQATHFSNFAAVGYSNSSLAGAYTIAGYHRAGITDNLQLPLSVASTPFTGGLTGNFNPTGFTSERLTATFDGAGNVAITQHSRNVDGTVSSVADASAAYSVSPDGTVTLPGLTGSVLAGGSVLVVGSSSGDPEIDVGIKQGGSFSNASLTGAYSAFDYFRNANATPVNIPVNVPSTPFSGNLQANFVSTGFTSEITDANFDGAGGVALARSRNSDGVFSNSTQAGTYSLASDGTLTVPGLQGSLLAGGSALLMTSSSGSPRISLGVRKGGSFDNTSLRGKYTLVDYSRASNSTALLMPLTVNSTPFSTNLNFNFQTTGFKSVISIATFDGAGGVSLAQTKNQDGIVSNATQSGTYSVANDGTMTAPGLTGRVLAGGSMFVLGSSSGDPEIAVGILR